MSPLPFKNRGAPRNDCARLSPKPPGALFPPDNLCRGNALRPLSCAGFMDISLSRAMSLISGLRANMLPRRPPITRLPSRQFLFSGFTPREKVQISMQSPRGKPDTLFPHGGRKSILN
jgi:hypothetical protein